MEENEEAEDEFDAEEAERREATTSALYVGRNGHPWQTLPRARTGRTAPSAKSICSGFSRGCPKCLLPVRTLEVADRLDIVDLVVKYTNQEIHHRALTHDQEAASPIEDPDNPPDEDRGNEDAEMPDQQRKPSSFASETNSTELQALFGLLHLQGVNKASKVNASELWSLHYGISIYRATMSKKRFQFLLTCLWFDDKSTRLARLPADNFTAIREVWGKFIGNSTRYYNPSHNLTIDEQLLAFRGNCRFRIYMKSKSAKCGLKIFMLNDSSTYYLFNAMPYIGKSALKKEKEEKEKQAKRK